MYAELGNLDESPFYADVSEAGGLAQAIQAQLKAIASSLRVKKGMALFPFAHASVTRIQAQLKAIAKKVNTGQLQHQLPRR